MSHISTHRRPQLVRIETMESRSYMTGLTPLANPTMMRNEISEVMVAGGLSTLVSGEAARPLPETRKDRPLEISGLPRFDQPLTHLNEPAGVPVTGATTNGYADPAEIT